MLSRMILPTALCTALFALVGWAGAEPDDGRLRLACAKGEVGPRAESMCREALRFSLRYGRYHILMEAMLREDIGKDETALPITRRDMVDASARVIDACLKGETHFTLANGKTRLLRPELAYDVGHWFGLLNPEAIIPLEEDEQERVAAQCFTRRPADSIRIGKRNIDPVRACFLVGASLTLPAQEIRPPRFHHISSASEGGSHVGNHP